MGTRGFTLIEILVVVAIIAILTALLMPQLRKGLDAAKSAACANNQKQLFICFNMFADDNRGCDPPGNTKYTGAKTDKDKIDWPYFSKDNSESTWDARWVNCLGPYFGKQDWIYTKSNWSIKTDGLPVACPAAPKPDCTDHLSYALNTHLGKHAYRTNKGCNSIMTKASQIPRPGISIMLIDSRKTATVGDIPTLEEYVTTMKEAHFEDGGVAKYSGKGGYRSAQAWRHMSGCNLLFADGRLKWIDWSSLAARLTSYKKPEGGWRLP